jgi:hypothetical protein
MDESFGPGLRRQTDARPRVLESLLDGPATVPQLSSRADVATGELTDILDSMILAGLVIRHEPLGDGVRFVGLTKVGLHAAMHGRVAGW